MMSKYSYDVIFPVYFATRLVYIATVRSLGGAFNEEYGLISFTIREIDMYVQKRYLPRSESLITFIYLREIPLVYS